MHNAKDMIEAIKRRTELYSSLNAIMDKDTKSAFDNIKNAPKVSKTLSRVGWMLFWIPEPTMVSNLIGIPMILAGKALSRYYNDLTIKDVANETADMLKSIEGFRYSLMNR